MLLRKKLRDRDLSKRNRKQRNKLKQMPKMQKMKMMMKIQLKKVVKSHLDLKEKQIYNLRKIKMKMTQYLLGLSLVF